jgi:hypothetical protein
VNTVIDEFAQRLPQQSRRRYAILPDRSGRFVVPARPARLAPRIIASLLAGMTLPGQGDSAHRVELAHSTREAPAESLAAGLPLAVPLAAATLSSDAGAAPPEPPVLEFTYLRLESAKPPTSGPY